ncbi:MAG: alanyl-tRNA editing protein [Gemmobacter sp.]|nr:alanyl-tRNA editing protein [Gemmobacter sp.]
MSDVLYRADPYLREVSAHVVAHTPEGGVVLDAALFYPTGGGQPGDSGWIDWAGGRLPVATTIKGEAGTSILLLAEPLPLPPVGEPVTLHLDWARRHLHMRVHTALHLLSVVIPLPVTGGQIGAGKGRLDFDMPEAPSDVAAIEAALNDLIARDLAVTDDWISDAELAANPGLVKTMSVKPPVGQGQVRLVRIGAGADQVDLQPCGGTHVARTAEIGRVSLGKIEKKGKINRRVSLTLDD